MTTHNPWQNDDCTGTIQFSGTTPSRNATEAVCDRCGAHWTRKPKTRVRHRRQEADLAQELPEPEQKDRP